MTVKLSDYVFRFLARRGVRHVFQVTGGGAMHLNDSLGACRGIEYVCTCTNRPQPWRRSRTRRWRTTSAFAS